MADSGIEARTVKRPMSGKWKIELIVLLLVSVSSCSVFVRKPPLNWHLTLQLASPPPNPQEVLNKSVEIIESRLNRAGVSSFLVRTEGTQIVVDLPMLPNSERIKNIVISEGRLELAHVISPPSPAPAQTFLSQEQALESFQGKLPANRRLLSYSEDVDRMPPQTRWVMVDANPIVRGGDIRNASAVPDRERDNYHVAFALRTDAAERLSHWTGENINEYLAVILNGEVKSIAYIRTQIYDSGEIAGRFTRASAEDLALILNSGPLPQPLKLVQESDN